MQIAEEAIGSVLVLGGGIAGIQAALDMANSGFYVYLVEKTPSIGGAWRSLTRPSLPTIVPCVSCPPNWWKLAGIKTSNLSLTLILNLLKALPEISR